MFIWGTYNGWYRVETPDHIFGWVYYSYINCPKSERLAELSDRKAKVASDRSARQTMYGSPQLLRRYYARYRAPGATQGLREMGVRVASAPRERASNRRSAARFRSFAKAPAYNSRPKYATRKYATRKPVVSSPRLAARPLASARATSAKTFTRASSQRAATRQTVARQAVTGQARPRTAVISRPPAISVLRPAVEDRNSTPLAPSQPDVMAAAQRVEREARERRIMAQRAAAQRAAAQRAAAQRIAALKATEERAAAQQAAEQRAIAQRMAQRMAAQRAAQQRAEAQRAAAQRMAALRIVEQRAAAQRIAARRAARRAAAERAAARRMAARRAAEQRRANRQNRVAQQRARLRQQLGSPVSMTPPMGLPGLRPITPEELLRARDAFLSSGRKPASAPLGEGRDNLQGRNNLQGASPRSGIGHDPLMPAITPSAFDGRSFNPTDPNPTVLNPTELNGAGATGIALSASFRGAGPGGLSYGSFDDIIMGRGKDLAPLPQLPQLPHVLTMSHAKIIAQGPGNFGYDTRQPATSTPGSKDGLFGTPEGVVNSENLVLPSSLPPSSASPLAVPSVAVPSAVFRPFTAPPSTGGRTSPTPAVTTLRPIFTLPLQAPRTASRTTASRGAVRLFPRRPSKVASGRIAPARIMSKARVGQGTLPSRGGSPRDYLAHMPQSGFGQGMATQALSYRGMPYIYGAASPRRGFDCSGLIYFLLRQRGYNPPRTAAGLASYGARVSQGNLETGDIVLFSNTYRRGVSHAGVYLGNGKFVHAASSGKGVRVDALSTKYWGRKFHSARRVK